MLRKKKKELFIVLGNIDQEHQGIQRELEEEMKLKLENN